ELLVGKDVLDRRPEDPARSRAEHQPDRQVESEGSPGIEPPVQEADLGGVPLPEAGHPGAPADALPARPAAVAVGGDPAGRGHPAAADELLGVAAPCRDEAVHDPVPQENLAQRAPTA